MNVPSPHQVFEWESSVHGAYSRWLVEPDQTVIQTLANQCLGLIGEQRCTSSFSDEGAYSKMYEIKLPSGPRSYLMRVLLPICPRVKTNSESATTELLQQRGHIPVPNIIAYSDTPDDVLGFEWILMEKLPGVPLARVWKQWSMEAKERLIASLAQYQAQISRPFNETDTAGSLCNVPPPRSMTQTHPGIYLSQGTPFEPALFVSLLLLRGRLDEMSHPRGPRQSSAAFFEAYIHSARFFLVQKLNEDRYDDELIKGGLEILTRIERVLPSLIDRVEGKKPSGTVLWHPDLDLQNILVDGDGTITGIIDWECASTAPLWQAHEYPDLLFSATRNAKPVKDNYGDAEKVEDVDEAKLELDMNNNFDNEGKCDLYWEHMEEWELTQLRKVYDREMTKLCPWWIEKKLERGKLLDVKCALDHVTRGYHSALREWLDKVEQGKGTSLRKMLFPDTEAESAAVDALSENNGAHTGRTIGGCSNSTCTARS